MAVFGFGPDREKRAAAAELGDRTSVSGVVIDDTTHAPIAGAVVVLSGTAAIPGATPPPSGAWPSATTRADGSFTITGVRATNWTLDFGFVGTATPRIAHAQWLEVFPSDGHAAFHAVRAIAPASETDLGAIDLAQPTPADRAWLERINRDRLALKATAEPLIFDSVTLQSARYWAQLMAGHGFFAHECPPALASCTALWKYETFRGSPPGSQNLAYNFDDWQGAENGFMDEAKRCPGFSWTTCTYDESTGHYLNIMRAAHWAGVAIAAGTPVASMWSPGLPRRASYYVEHFASPQVLVGSEN